MWMHDGSDFDLGFLGAKAMLGALKSLILWDQEGEGEEKEKLPFLNVKSHFRRQFLV